MRLCPALALCLLPVVGACTQFPALDRATDPAVFAAPFPTLLPFEQLQPAIATLPAVDPAPDVAADVAADLATRAAALRRRADSLSAQP